MTAEIGSIGVVGAGTMGRGIAQVAAQAGYRTLLFDLTIEQAQSALTKLREVLDAGVQKGKVTTALRDETLSRLSAVNTLEALRDCGLVIEAAPEDLALKQSLFAKLSMLCAPSAVLASNTSSLSLTELSSAVSGPERVIGMHFFNPVHVMKLLELVRGFHTSDATLAAARQVGERMGKQTIVVQDSPGFASSRLGIALGMEAIRMLEEGVASAEDIDKAMKLGYGHPMGPLELTDLVGLDVRLAIGDYLFRELGNPAFRPPQLLKKMVRAGKLGKKSKEGFYRY